MTKTKKKPTVVAKKTNKSGTKHHAKQPVKSSKPVTAKVDPKALSSRTKEILKNINKPLTRTQQVAYLADTTGLAKRDVSLLMDSLETTIAHHLKNLGEISLGGLMKLTVIKKPATKAREGVNPFTGQPTVFKAKPAKKVVKIRALKKVKDMVV